MSRTRILLISLLLATIAGGVLFKLWPVPSLPKQKGEEPAIALAKPTLTRFDEQGHRLWELVAESITVDRGHDRSEALGTQLKFFKDGRVTLEVAAARLTLFNKSEEMELEGGIEAHNDQGLSFHTERMRWDPQREVLIGEGEVEVMQGKNKLTGRGFEYSPKKEELKIKQGAHLIISPR